MNTKITIQRALISCWDKTGVETLAAELSGRGVEIISSGGTAVYLQKNHIPVTKVEDITGFPEMLDGRVKTLHPFIHGAILAKRTPEHISQLRERGIKPIDLVVVNLYPFLENVNTEGKKLDEMVELIDIGGPAMLRAAAKNFAYVTILHRPAQYQDFLKELEKNGGSISFDFRRQCAADAFFYSAYYDSQIASYLDDTLSGKSLAPRFSQFFIKKEDLRYGENPHQQAALYDKFTQSGASANGLKQHWGKEMSYNNYVDVTAAYSLVSEFTDPMVAIIKHTNPCGAASAASLPEAFRKALATDAVSAYGGIVAVNRRVDRETADLIRQSFYECVIAPGYEDAALETLKKKKNLRILERALFTEKDAPQEYKYLPVGLLVQQADAKDYDPEKLSTVSGREPDEREKADLLFAWKIVKYVKSNAIIFVKNGQLLGVGAGQMSRVDSVKLAAEKARDAGHHLQGACMASDAFFPFRDGVDEAYKAGIVAVIQPGGSIRDEEVIVAAKEHNMAMLFTGIRHFKH